MSAKHILRLHEGILALHKTHLPETKRLLGDGCIRDEFERHQSAKPEFLMGFVREWESYRDILKAEGSEVRTYYDD